MMEAAFSQTLVLPQIYADVKKRFKDIEDLAHGWEHVNRVYNLALRIADREGADRFIVGVAALMHDLGQTISADQRPDHHADTSVQLATKMLQSYEVPEDQQQAIGHAILAHSFSRNVTPDTLEARVVRDADRLDALGAIGILRWAIVGTQRSTPTTQTYHPEDPMGERHELDDNVYMLDHFHTKLLKIGDTMATESGKILAYSRVSFMNSYLDEFKRELELF